MAEPSAPADFTGQVAFVTGAASGIGAAVARRLAAGGARVAVADLDLPAASALAEEIEAADGDGRALALRVDVSDFDSVREAVRATSTAFGGLRLAVNNAGIAAPGALTAQYPLSTWRRLLAVNLDGVFYSLRCEIPELIAAGGGSIVNLASIAGTVALRGQIAYTAAKHAVVGMTKAAAVEYADQGIRVNAIGPGYVDTPMLRPATGATADPVEAAAAAQRRQDIVDLHPVGRLGTPEEIAELAAFLLSERAPFMTGGYYVADGGYTAR